MTVTETSPAPAAARPRRPMLIRLFSGFLTVCTLATLALLLFSYLLPQRLTVTRQPYLTLACISFAGRTLTFHFGVALLVAALAAMALKRRRFAGLVALAGVVALLPTIGSYWPEHPPAPAAGDSGRLRVMSFNVFVKNDDLPAMVKAIRAEHPDVLVLSEYTPAAEAAVLEAFGEEFPHRSLAARRDTSGMAIYSRLPFVEPVRDRAGLWNQRTVFRAVVRAGDGRSIVLYALHLSAPVSMRSVGWNRLQVAKLADDLRGEVLPVIVTGDFNFTETTPNFTALCDTGLRSAHDLAGCGRGCTWPFRPAYRQWLPGVRIDHVLLSGQLTCTHFEVGPDGGSDHRPVVADVAFAAAPPRAATTAGQ